MATTTPGALANITGSVIGRSAPTVPGPTGPVWLMPFSPPEPSHPCSFCATATTAPASTKHDWHVCLAKHCQAASVAQAERIYAGLFDSPETRQAALNWVKNRG